MPKTQASCTSSSRKGTHFCNFLHFHSPRAQVNFLKRISYKELNRATDSFRRIITCDSQTITYEARFQDGSVSVVKEVRIADQRIEVFHKELQLLGRLHHRHVVPLRGYSLGSRSFLVFESTAKGSLKDHLNDPLRTPLSWKTRVQIALGVASALEYLQFFCEPPVNHMSISSSDIILDEKLVPKLSNIGYLCSEGGSSTPAASKVRANMIPQFGALLLELITGQSLPKESTDAIQWIRELRCNISMHNMIDPDLGISYTSKELTNLLSVARMCIRVEDTQAFTIAHICRYLQVRFGNICT